MNHRLRVDPFTRVPDLPEVVNYDLKKEQEVPFPKQYSSLPYDG